MKRPKVMTAAGRGVELYMWAHGLGATSPERFLDASVAFQSEGLPAVPAGGMKMP